MNKLKRVVIKEEFVALTGDFKKAVILNQLIYWSERVKDFDSFVKEENKRMNNNDIDDKPIALQHGWIYKKAEDLSSETMLNLSKQTIGRLLDDLCKNKWIEQRRNPRYKWDKTYQYRVNLINIAVDLKKLGYILQDYKIDINELIPNSILELQDTKTELCNNKNGTAISEITLEITKTESSIKVKGSSNNDRGIGYSIFINLYRDNENYNEDIDNSIKYLLERRFAIYGFKSPKYKHNTWVGIFNNWFDVDTGYGNERIDYDQSVEMIDTFLETEFENEKCDYSPALFSSDEVKRLRYVECNH